MKNQFEQYLKQSLGNYEVKYNSAHWTDMESRLNKASVGKSLSAGKILGIAAGIITVAGLIYFFIANNSENKQQKNTTITAQKFSANNNDSKNNQINKLNTETKSEVTSVNNSNKEKVNTNNKDTEKKIISTETSETQTSNNTKENRTDTKEQVQITKTEPPLSPNSAFNAAFHLNQNSVCAGTTVEFNADNAKVPCTYHWEFGDGKTSGEQSPKHVYQKTGTYTVKLRLTSTTDKTSDEQKNTLIVNPSPNIEVNYSASNENPSLINFEAKDGSVREWSWDFGDKQVSKEQSPSHAYSKKSNYDVIVTATNYSGCSSSSRKLVNIENLFPLAPTGFSPNNDGTNDSWIPASFANGDYNFTLTISDKSGREVYKTSDKNSPWDGANTKVGETFSWKAEVKDKNGKVSSYSGYIIIAE